MKRSREDLIFDIIVTSVLTLLAMIVLYPLYFVVIASFSNPDFVNSGKIVFYPRGVNIEGYKQIFYDASIWRGYLNSLLYTVGFTAVGVSMTICTAYSLSRKDLVGRKFLMGVFIFTMYFSGGLIPLYILVNKLSLYGKPIVIVILGSLSVYNMIIARTYFINSLPEEMYEAATIDGCGNGRYFLQIVLPLSKTIIAVMIVFYAVHQWNSYFYALIFLSKAEHFPLQLVLREILLQSKLVQPTMNENMMLEQLERQRYAELIKYGIIVVSSVPVLIAYPFAQKYFVKGVMIGSVKG